MICLASLKTILKRGKVRILPIKKFCLILLVLILQAGCSTTPPSPARRLFWPLAPDEPKIEYLGTYQLNTDLPKEGTASDKFWSDILGEETYPLFVKPWGIAADGEGKIFVTDAGQSSIVVLDLKKRNISRIEDVKGAYGIVTDKKDRLYVTSSAHMTVLVYDTDGNPLFNFGEDAIKSPGGIAVNDRLERIYVADPRDHNIKVFDASGMLQFTIGERGVGKGQLNFPTSVAINSRGELVVTDMINARIQVFDADGNFIRAFGKRGTGRNDFKFIKGVAVDSEDHIYVTDAMGSHFKIFSMEGDLLLIVGGPYSGKVPGGFNLPMDIYIDEKDTIYIVDQQNTAFQVFQYLNADYLKEHPVK